MNKDFFKLGIIGNPLSHSVSPIMQIEALKSVNLTGSYEKFEIQTNEIEKYLNFFIENNFTGFNVTIPHKIEIMKYLTEIDATALKIGAVNTVKINFDGSTKGYNTDIYGFIQGVNGKIQTIKNATVLGCGGAALAVVFGLEKLGCKYVTVAVRNISKGEKFVSDLKNKTDMEFIVKDISSLNIVEDTDILINATPLGMSGNNENEIPIGLNALKMAKKTMLIYDLIYNPSKTLLLEMAADMGFQFVNGLDMLVYQGAKAFEIWTGFYPDVEKMKQVILN